jgi:uncharacterized protein (UPF0332 family)
MTPETRMLVQYRLARAREALAEASLLLDSGHANTGVNRLYYACFYAVSALLLTQGLTATSHSGLRTLFHQHVIRPGLLPLGQGPLYDRLFDQRQRSDYADLVRFGVDEVCAWAMEAQAFVDVVAVLIQQALAAPLPGPNGGNSGLS